MSLYPYKVDIGAYQLKPHGKVPNQDKKQNIGADPGDSGKPQDTICLGRRRGSYTTAPSVANRRIVL
jgi:hypothetical protein